MADKKTCNELLAKPARGWQVLRCSKPAKWLCKDSCHEFYCCGIHAKRYEKVEEIKNG